MKYLRYSLIVIMKVLGKIIGLVWYYFAVPFRAYSRNVVYNYVLQNDIYLPRLLEREPYYNEGKYILKNIRGTELIGYINYRGISKLEYYIVLWLLWVWVDDDSNIDTHDGTKAQYGIKWGNAFDLGDVRDTLPVFDFKLSSLWNIRNSFYNFNYMFEEIREDDKNNFYARFTNKFFDWHFGYIPYSNSKRKGRLVFFSEDIYKIDKAKG